MKTLRRVNPYPIIAWALALALDAAVVVVGLRVVGFFQIAFGG